MSSPRLCRTVFVVAAVCGAWCSSSPAQPPTSKGRSAPATKPAAAKKDADVQPASGTEKSSKPQRPQPQELRIEPLPPALEQILREWELASGKIKTLHGKHQRIVYNHVFEVEKQAGGEFYYEAPDKGRIDLEGIEPEEGQKAKRNNPKTGNPYRIEADTPSKWICTGKEILNINEADKTYEVFPLPEELHGKNIIHGPLPFLFGMKAEDAKRRFELSFVDEENPKKNNDKVAWIRARPRQVMDKDNFQEAEIILDRERYLPFAVKLIDPSGNLETVYTFSKKDLHVNKRELIPEIFRNDPFHPNLKRYKMILPPQAVQKDQSDGGEETGRAGIRQTGSATAGPSKAARTVKGNDSATKRR